MKMKIEEILELHKRTKTAIMQDQRTTYEAAYPLTLEYPALRGKTVAITWETRHEWFTAKEHIIRAGQAADRKAHPRRGFKTEGQRRWIAMAVRMGWI